MQYFAGLDWGCQKHAVCVVDETGKIVDRFEVAHDRAGLEAMVRRLERIMSQIPNATASRSLPSNHVTGCLPALLVVGWLNDQIRQLRS